MIYKTIEKLRPYFVSLRELEGNVSLDMRFPLKWKHDIKYDGLQTIIQDEKYETRLISFVMLANEDGYNAVIDVVSEIIKFNLEREEKEKLFHSKIDELKSLFERESLDSLKKLNFLNDEEKKNIKTGDTAGNGVVDEGSKEG